MKFNFQTSSSGTFAELLQFLNVQIITNTACRSRLSAANAALIDDNILCTSSPTGSGVCIGDAGGPVINLGWLVGTVSWGVGCAMGSPDMHTRISQYRKF